MPIMRAFQQLYYTVVALLLAAVACLPWLVPLSYRALGYEPRLAHAGTFAAFRAHLATTALRRQFLAGVLGLALILAVWSLAALVLRARRRVALPWPLLALATVGAAVVAVVAIAGLTAGSCC